MVASIRFYLLSILGSLLIINSVYAKKTEIKSRLSADASSDTQKTTQTKNTAQPKANSSNSTKATTTSDSNNNNPTQNQTNTNEPLKQNSTAKQTASTAKNTTSDSSTTNQQTAPTASTETDTASETSNTPQPPAAKQTTPSANNNTAANNLNINNSNQNPTASNIEVNNKFYIISEFDFPEDHELHIKIWKNGRESKEYYVFEKGVGVRIGEYTVRFPHVDALCCIKYGKKGNLKPFSIDLNKNGKGLTDLPGCKVQGANHPNDSLNIDLPSQTPDFNM